MRASEKSSRDPGADGADSADIEDITSEALPQTGKHVGRLGLPSAVFDCPSIDHPNTLRNA
jgi:hypothetical protein